MLYGPASHNVTILKSRRIPKRFFASLRKARRGTQRRMARRKPTTARKKGFGAASFFLTVFVLALLAAGVAAWLVLTPFGPESETFIEVTPGSSTVHISRQLQQAGIIRSQVAFDIVRFWKRGTLKAGAYRFDHPAAALFLRGL